RRWDDRVPVRASGGRPPSRRRIAFARNECNRWRNRFQRAFRRRGGRVPVRPAPHRRVHRGGATRPGQTVVTWPAVWRRSCRRPHSPNASGYSSFTPIVRLSAVHGETLEQSKPRKSSLSMTWTDRRRATSPLSAKNPTPPDVRRLSLQEPANCSFIVTEKW